MLIGCPFSDIVRAIPFGRLTGDGGHHIMFLGYPVPYPRSLFWR